MDALMLSRLQFAATAAFHFIFVPLTLGLSLLVGRESKTCARASMATVRPPPRLPHTQGGRAVGAGLPGGLFLMGAGMALSPCAPLSALLLAASATGSVTGGLLLGASFGVGAVLIPALVFGLLVAHVGGEVRGHLTHWRGALERTAAVLLIVLGPRPPQVGWGHDRFTARADWGVIARHGLTPILHRREYPMEFLKANLDYAIVGVLGLMSFLMVWLAIERYLYLRRVNVCVFSHLDELTVALTRNLTELSSIGASAPYVGLLGTVLGILITFYDLGQGGNIEVKTIMVGLALALKATALGLLVAIPAILFYNGLLRRVEVLTAEWKKMKGHETV
jgi:biopolymer transport protein ExbB